MVLAGVAAALVLSLLLGGLGRTRGTKSTPASRVEPSASATTAPAAGPGSVASDGSEKSASASRRAPGSATLAPAPAADDAGASAGAERIVKTGSVDLEVPRHAFSDRVTRFTGAVTGLGGFVAESSTSEQGATPTGTISLRVPADRFEPLLVEVRHLGRVRAVTSSAQDVTSEYTDVTGRLKTMQDERTSLGLVLTDAKNVPDILAVRDRLNTVQAEIEQLAGRRKVLDDQTALATLTVSLREPGPRQHPAPRPADRSGLGQAWHEAVDGFTGGIEAIVAGSGKVVLVGLCAGVLWLVGRPFWHRYRRSMA